MDNSGPDADPSFLLHPEPAAVHDAPSPSPVDSVHGASAAPSARPPARAAWSQYNPFALVSSWYWPTSPAHAEAAESRLLSRLRFFGRRDSADRTGSRTSVRVSFVDLGDGRHINSLVVDEEHVQEGVAIHQQDSEADGGDDTFGYTPGTEQTKLDIFRADGVERDPKARERRTLVICHGMAKVTVPDWGSSTATVVAHPAAATPKVVPRPELADFGRAGREADRGLLRRQPGRLAEEGRHREDDALRALPRRLPVRRVRAQVPRERGCPAAREPG
ncbi:MAG: hypothetical protein BJ554DRAFT_5670 [Olpidium bornovanus]|uniref:Uncharacterized protein n=1 Tax=Olpidium bornovanus TaxID=278681 RepID=A0A8H7ZZD6_9FUNG|nr:MAG: hypothetical protein BJ554DRAFT_5670 [Olpidium bornovanus]